MIKALALLAALAAAQPAPSVAELKERFIAAMDAQDRGEALAALSKTAPSSAQDVAALFDLFSRFPDANLRQAAMESLSRLQQGSPALEPLFVAYLSQPEPESQLFGVNGAFRLRSSRALPLVRKIAERKFAAPEAASITVLNDRNAWWTQYEAISALAQWEGEKAYPLVRAKSLESPAVARLLAQFYWTKAVPDIAKWARSKKADDRQRALEAAGAPISPEDARATRAELLSLVRDPSLETPLRHRLGLKVGAVSDAAQAAELVAEHDKSAGESKLIWAAAAFASRQEAAIPLLVRYARESSEPLYRDGARAQLEDMLGTEKAKALLEKKAP